MACMAGLLGIKLRKPGVYTLGNGVQSTQAEHLTEAWQLCRAAGYLGFFLLALCVLSGLVPLYFSLHPK